MNFCYPEKSSKIFWIDMQQNKHLDDLRFWALSYAEPKKCGPDGYVNEGGVGVTKGYWLTEDGIQLRSFMINEFAFASTAKTADEAAEIACHMMRGVLAEYFSQGHGPIYWRVEPELSFWRAAAKTDVGPEGPFTDEFESQRFWLGPEYCLAKVYGRCWRSGSPDRVPQGNIGWIKNYSGLVVLPARDLKEAA